MNDKNLFHGTGVAIVTPFSEDNRIDYNALSKLIRHIIKGSVNYLVVLGTTGESVVLSSEEKKELTQFVIQEANNKLPIVLGMGSNNTQEILDRFKQEDFEGIDAFLSVAPYYNKPGQTGLYQHFSSIAKASPKPIILYNVPGRTSSNIQAATTLKLANEHENIIAIKEASGDLGQISRIIKDKPEDFLVISGDDALTVPIISVGGSGVISVMANAFPEEVSNMVNYALSGDFDKAALHHSKFIDFIDLLFCDGNPAGIKAALKVLEISGDNIRLPLVKVNDDTYQKISKEIKSVFL